MRIRHTMDCTDSEPEIKTFLQLMPYYETDYEMWVVAYCDKCGAHNRQLREDYQEEVKNENQ